MLGSEAYLPNGSYNRLWVASQVFTQPSLLQKLNALVHPRVGEDTELWLKQHKDAPYVVKEAAIMGKAGQNNSLDKIVVVHAPIEIRVARVLKRDTQRSESEVRDIIARQMTEEERFRIAHYVLYNDESQLLVPQVWQLHQDFSRCS
ncbi:MAG: dephospho-CoA kinase [Spirosomataceae bacterium]